MGLEGRGEGSVSVRRQDPGSGEDTKLLLARRGERSWHTHVSLNYLEVDHPQMHLMIDKDGKTNQPVPKHSNTSKTSVPDTLLDLKARQVVLANGVVLLNDRAIPFDLAARDVDAEVHYIVSDDRYGMTLDLQDLRTKMAAQPEAQSALHVEGELGRDVAELQKLEFSTGKSSKLEGTASIDDFAKPVWQATVKGTVELKQISVLADVEGLNAGTVDLDLSGHSCPVTAGVAEKRKRFWQRSRSKAQGKPGAKLQPTDPGCVVGYLLTGTAKLHKASYRNVNVRLHEHIDGGCDVAAYYSI